MRRRRRPLRKKQRRAARIIAFLFFCALAVALIKLVPYGFSALRRTAAEETAAQVTRSVIISLPEELLCDNLKESLSAYGVTVEGLAIKSSCMFTVSLRVKKGVFGLSGEISGELSGVLCFSEGLFYTEELTVVSGFSKIPAEGFKKQLDAQVNGALSQICKEQKVAPEQIYSLDGELVIAGADNS